MPKTLVTITRNEDCYNDNTFGRFRWGHMDLREIRVREILREQLSLTSRSVAYKRDGLLTMAVTIYIDKQFQLKLRFGRFCENS